MVFDMKYLKISSAWNFVKSDIRVVCKLHTVVQQNKENSLTIIPLWIFLQGGPKLLSAWFHSVFGTEQIELIYFVGAKYV